MHGTLSTSINDHIPRHWHSLHGVLPCIWLSEVTWCRQLICNKMMNNLLTTLACTDLWFSLPITQSEIISPIATLGDGIKPAMHSILLPLISLLAVVSAVEFNWTAPGSAKVMSWNQNGPHEGATGAGALWTISVQQFIGELIIHTVAPDPAFIIMTTGQWDLFTSTCYDTSVTLRWLGCYKVWSVGSFRKWPTN